MKHKKYKDYFWRAPNLDVYRIAPYWGASNLDTLYCNGKVFFLAVNDFIALYAL